ncbi:MAG: DNA replication and repair protein RecF [Patescibacteria group bacterium]
MKIIKAKFQQFRNLGPIELTPVSGANILVGRNAQGKTNILEGMFAVAAGGSFRVSNERSLIQHGQEFARVEFEFEKDGEIKRAEMIWMMEGGFARKTTKLNGVVVQRVEIIRQMPVVLFSPEDIDLIRLSPQKRRKFLDLLIARFDLEYGQDLVDYWKVLRQRNQLLLMIKQGRSGEGELEVWDEKMSELGARIVEKRKQAMEEVGRLANQYYHDWFGESGDILKISYVPSLNFETPKMYGAGLAGARSMDVVRANTTKGIHRDDVLFILNGDDMRAAASRGEFRSAVMALKLAEGEILKTKLHDAPVYLLDDIFSELDDERQAKLARALVGVQSFVTTNDKQIAELFEQPAVNMVEGGSINPVIPTKVGI